LAPAELKAVPGRPAKYDTAAAAAAAATEEVRRTGFF